MNKGFETITGELVDVHHAATVHGGGAGGHVSIWTVEHREVWIRQADGVEVQIVMPGSLLPARAGHRVTVLIDNGNVIGLINWSTRQRVNYGLVGSAYQAVNFH
jgi:hypothetical protein